MEDFEYKDKTVVINRGTTIIWANNDTAAHNVIQDDRKFASGTMPKGDTFPYTFNEAGRFPYYCEFHGDKGGIDMAGLVIVQ
ncbi:MAG: blue (type 1) copper domain protein [Dehalococcoidia bacterium]|nr:blue (type 1) copper domain protein [Dehalococcoidia bacterium]